MLKKFCRAQGVYGAESYIKGFSGYVLEILTIHYGTFFDSIKAISRWKLPVYIDLNKFYRSRKDAFKKINKSKRVNELIIVDPTQKDRNASAAISKDKINSLIKACKEYLHNPSDEFFLEKRLMIKDLVVESGENILLLGKIKAMKGKKDVVGSKIVKIYDYIEKQLKKHDFEVMKSNWHFNKDSLIYYIIKDEILSEKIIHRGPPLKQKRHVKEFKEKYKDHTINKGTLYVKLDREAKTLKEFVKKLRRNSYIKSNIRKIKFKLM